MPGHPAEKIPKLDPAADPFLRNNPVRQRRQTETGQTDRQTVKKTYFHRGIDSVMTKQDKQYKAEKQTIKQIKRTTGKQARTSFKKFPL